MTLRSHHYTPPRLRRPVRSEPLRGANGGLDAGGALLLLPTPRRLLGSIGLGRMIPLSGPASQSSLRRQAVAIVLQVDVPLLDAAPEPLDEPVVDPPAPPIQAHVHPDRLHRFQIRAGSE